MAEISVYFKAEKDIKKNFDAAVALTDFNNKQVLKDKIIYRNEMWG